MLKISVALVIASLAATPALANDSSAELSAGGLVLVPNSDIEMRAEDLFVSTKEVRVRYRFFNTSDKDVTILVAFPMPDISVEHQDANISVPTEDPVNILGFATQVNGQPVATKVEQRVIALGIDRTALLRELGIPLAPHLASTNEALDKLPRDKAALLARYGLAAVEEYDVGKGMEQHLTARWTLQTTFYWEQTFPAQKETAIEHRYKPSVGGSAGTMIGDIDSMKEPWFADYRKKYCIDKAFLDAVARAKKAAGEDAMAPFQEERIEYILKTGGNWAGPIGQFRLVVDKGERTSLVSFCGTDVRKISDTQFEMKATDFVPENNLSILILKKQSEN